MVDEVGAPAPGLHDGLERLGNGQGLKRSRLIKLKHARGQELLGNHLRFEFG